MKGRITVLLFAHILVLTGLGAFFGSFPAMLPGLLLSLTRPDVLVSNCSVRPEGCVALAGLWAVLIVAVLLVVLDVRILRQPEGSEGRLWRSLALQLLLPAGWWAALASMGRSDLIGPAWYLLPGPPILLSLVVSAAVAFLTISGELGPALGKTRLWIERAITLLLALAGGALAYLFADLLIGQY